jgi:predicted RNA-binding Zn ribbon-like protein
VAIARAELPTPGDLGALRAAYCAALQHAHLALQAGGYAWKWAETDALEWLIWPVVRSAVELLTSPEVVRVKECANAAGCGWLFLDRSKNGSRR